MSQRQRDEIETSTVSLEFDLPVGLAQLVEERHEEGRVLLRLPEGRAVD